MAELAWTAEKPTKRGRYVHCLTRPGMSPIVSIVEAQRDGKGLHGISKTGVRYSWRAWLGHWFGPLPEMPG